MNPLAASVPLIVGDRLPRVDLARAKTELAAPKRGFRSENFEVRPDIFEVVRSNLELWLDRSELPPHKSKFQWSNFELLPNVFRFRLRKLEFQRNRIKPRAMIL